MLPKEAFDKAIAQNVSIPFAALFRFINMAKVRGYRLIQM